MKAIRDWWRGYSANNIELLKEKLKEPRLGIVIMLTKSEWKAMIHGELLK